MRVARSRRAAALAVSSLALLTFPSGGAGQVRPDTTVVELAEVRVEVARLAVGGIPVAKLPFAAQVVTGERLRARGHLTAADALRHLPGVSFTDVMGTAAQPELSMRGFGVSPVVGLPQGLSVFVDGVRVNEPDASQVNFSLIPMRDLRRVEVLRGPSGPFGKNTLGGAINMVTRRGWEMRGVEAELAGGSFSHAEGHVAAGGALGRGFDGYASTGYLRSGGWRQDAFTGMANAFTKVGWRNSAADAWLSYTFARDSILQAGSLPRSWLQDPGSVPPQFAIAGDPRRINFTGGDFFGPRLHFLNFGSTLSVGSDLSIGVNAFHRRNDARQFNANFVEADIRIVSAVRSTGATAQVTRDVGRQVVAAGLEYVFNDVALDIYQHPNVNHPHLPGSGLQTEDVGTREHNVGAFVHGRAAVGRGIGLTGGLRFDHVDLPFRDRLDPTNDGDNRFQQLTGSFGVDLETRPGVLLFAGYGRGFRAPVLMELACADPEAPCPLPYELGADPPLDPVTTDTWQAGVRLLRGRIAAEVVGFRAEVHDDIFFVQPPETRAGFFQNLERTRREGVEVALLARPRRDLRLDAGLGVTRATFQTTATLWAPYLDDDDDEDGDDGEHDLDLDPPTVRPGSRFPMVPDVTLSAGAEWTPRRWAVSVSAHHTGRQWLRGDEENLSPQTRLHGYTLVHGRLERSVGRAAVFVSADNLLDARHATFGVLTLNRLNDPGEPVLEPFVTPGQPRRVMAGVRMGPR